MGTPNHCGIAEKVQQCRKYFLQYSTFVFERLPVRTWGRQTCFLPRAPSNLVTHLEAKTLCLYKEQLCAVAALCSRASEGGAEGLGPTGFVHCSKKVCFLSFEWEKNKFHHFWSPSEKLLEKSTSAPPPGKNPSDAFCAANTLYL